MLTYYILDPSLMLSDNGVMLSDQEIKKILLTENIKTIFLQFIDINGKIKTLNMPAKQIDDILQNKVMFDGSSISGFRVNETMDLRIYPDKSTFLIFPFDFSNLRNSARFICDIHNSDGTPFDGCPRSNLKRIIKLSADAGYKMNIGPELEFFLFRTDENNNILNIAAESTGYYDLNRSNEYDEALINILVSLQKMGFEIDALHHEGAPFQHEIDLGYDDILKTADNIITFKFITKIIADNFGFKASFMPKPVYGQNGSGLHLNISITDVEGNNLFFDDSDANKLSETAYNAIGSLLKNIKGITAVLNPAINSYKRLVKDHEAPIYIVWSIVTRSALIRIPAKRGNSTRLELRSADCAANPYLAFAVLLQACVDGIRKKVEPPAPVEKNLFLLSGNEIRQRKIKSLPRNLFTALEEFEKSMVSQVALGDYIFNEFLSSKRIEWNDYRKQVTPWELEKYLDV